MVEELQAHPRKVILALGNAALWAVTNQYATKITRARGKLYATDLSSVGCVATVHPAFLLRGGGSLRQFRADVQYAVSLAQGGAIRTTPDVSWTIMDTEEKILSFIAAAESEPVVTADYETTGFHHRLDKIICAGYTIGDGTHSYILPVMDHPELLPWLEVIHQIPSRFNWHNGKFDIKFGHMAGAPSARVDDDTMMLSYALDETRGVHDLETVASDWLGSPNWKNELKKHIPKKGNYSHVPRPVLYLYLAKDLYNQHALLSILRPLVFRDPKSTRLYTEVLIPGSEYLAEVEKTGMFVDVPRVEENAQNFGSVKKEYADAFNEVLVKSGFSEVNLNSPIQVAEALYDNLKIPSKTRSTNVDAMKVLAPKHAIVRILQNYRKVQKAEGTYVTPAIDHIADDGRVHQTYLLHGTATGRLACRDPNLQNVPRDPRLRGQYIAAPGYVYVEPDLNQAELRSLAVLSGDAELCRIYSSDTLSIHEEVRADIWGQADSWSEEQWKNYMREFFCERDQVVGEQKMKAKNVNFGIVYGITEFGLAEQSGCTPGEARKRLIKWANRFPDAWKFITACKMAPIKGQGLVTVFGHRKRFQIVSPEKLRDIQNEAANFPHQSTASTITLLAGIRMWKRLRENYDARIVNTVHDSILIEVPDNLETVRTVVTEITAMMEQIPVDYGLTRVPFKADAKAGKRWGSLYEIGETQIAKPGRKAKGCAEWYAGKMAAPWEIGSPDQKVTS